MARFGPFWLRVGVRGRVKGWAGLGLRPYLDPTRKASQLLYKTMQYVNSLTPIIQIHAIRFQEDKLGKNIGMIRARQNIGMIRARQNIGMIIINTIHTRAIISCCAVALVQHLAQNSRFAQHAIMGAQFSSPQAEVFVAAFLFAGGVFF